MLHAPLHATFDARSALRLLSLALAGAAAACATVTPKDFVAESANGKINGKPWRYMHAYVDPTVETPEEEDVVFILLAYKPKSECPTTAEAGKDPRTIMVSAPKNRKLTRLKGGTSRNLVFHVERQAKQSATVAKTGKFLLTDITDHTVKGKIYGNFNESNWVSGTFSAVLCDFRDLKSR